MRIEICGGIASGKTTLATLLKGMGYAVVYEDFKSNPFWTVFYSDPDRYKFETELTFLLQHYHGIKSLETSSEVVICDYSLLQDVCYCDATLTGYQRQTYVAVHEQIMREMGNPSLLVHLNCSASDELKRLRARGRKEEQEIGVNYLDALNNAILDRLSNYEGEILTIDTIKTNLIYSETDQERVKNLVKSNIGL